jgi:hypothetical protein
MQRDGAATFDVENSDWLLTLLTAVLALMIFVFAPLQATGTFDAAGFLALGDAVARSERIASHLAASG